MPTTAALETSPRTAELPVEAGCYADDASGREAYVRAVAAERIASRSPIYPNRGLGFGYAAIVRGLRGFPTAAICLANLRAGEGFTLGGKRHVLTSTGKRLTLQVGETVVRISPDSAAWERIERDVDGLLVASMHGADAGDLVKAWERDPVARYGSEDSAKLMAARRQVHGVLH